MLQKVEDTLDQAIESVRAGRSSIDDALTSRPELREELEPLVRLAVAIDAPPESTPSPGFRVAARARLMREAQNRYVTKPNPGRMAWVRNPFGAWRLGMPGVTTALALVLALVFSGGGVWAAQDALPGDALYGVKLAAERVQLATASSPEQRAQWYVDAAGTRMGEAVGILDRDRDRDRLSQQSALEAEQLLVEASAVASQMSAGDGQAIARERIQAAFARLDGVLARVQAQAPAEADPALAQARERVQAHLHAIETRQSPSEPDPQLPEPARNRHEVGPQPTVAPGFGPGPGPRAGAPEEKPSRSEAPVESRTATQAPTRQQTQPEPAQTQTQQQTQQQGQAGEPTQEPNQEQSQQHSQDPAQQQNQEQPQDQTQEQNQEQFQNQTREQSGEQSEPSPAPSPAPAPEPSPAAQWGAGSQPGPAPEPEREPSPEPEPQPGPGSTSGPWQGG